VGFVYLVDILLTALKGGRPMQFVQQTLPHFRPVFSIETQIASETLFLAPGVVVWQIWERWGHAR
jgi:hypothetical protein